MEMAHVRYFLALRKERSFTRAARRCGVAQSSLSNAIKALEEELGARLFDRKWGGVVLTDFGAAVEPYFLAIAGNVERIGRVRRPKSQLEEDRRLANRPDGSGDTADDQAPRPFRAKMLRL
jgi:DNA-binding transcriptional LysR family regulator